MNTNSCLPRVMILTYVMMKHFATQEKFVVLIAEEEKLNSVLQVPGKSSLVKILMSAIMTLSADFQIHAAETTVVLLCKHVCRATGLQTLFVKAIQIAARMELHVLVIPALHKLVIPVSAQTVLRHALTEAGIAHVLTKPNPKQKSVMDWIMTVTRWWITQTKWDKHVQIMLLVFALHTALTLTQVY